MQLYAGSTADFITDAIQHRVAEKLGESYYRYFRFRASASEFASWQNSLVALTAQVQYSGLRDHGIVLEMQLPLSSARLEAMITGHDVSGAERAVIIEPSSGPMSNRRTSMIASLPFSAANSARSRIRAFRSRIIVVI